MPKPRDLPALAAGLTTVTLWSSAFVAIRAAGRVLEPGSITLGRLVVSSSILSAVALARRERLPPRSAWPPIALFGVLFLGAYSVALNAAERRVDAGTSAMVVNTGPLLIAVLAGILLREGFPRALLAGCCVAAAGCVVIGLATTRATRGSAPGLLLLAAATLAYAAGVVVQKLALARASAFQVTWLGCAAATVVCVPFLGGLVHDGGRALGWLVYLGALPTALGFATWSFALRRATAGRAAALNYLIPVVATALAWGRLGERPPLLAAAGGALCLCGVYVARRPRVISSRRRRGRRAFAGRERPRRG